MRFTELPDQFCGSVSVIREHNSSRTFKHGEQFLAFKACLLQRSFQESVLNDNQSYLVLETLPSEITGVSSIELCSVSQVKVTVFIQNISQTVNYFGLFVFSHNLSEVYLSVTRQGSWDQPSDPRSLCLTGIYF